MLPACWWCCLRPLDHDDGSRYYQDDYNLFLYGGFKNLFGNKKVAQNNLSVGCFPACKLADV